jgi:hypothetical protein
MFPFFGGYGGHFEATYRAFPLAFIDKTSAEYGDKVILPPSALDRLGGWRAQCADMLLSVLLTSTSSSSSTGPCACMHVRAGASCALTRHDAPHTPCPTPNSPAAH